MKPLYVYYGRRLFLLASFLTLSLVLYVYLFEPGVLAGALFVVTLLAWTAMILCGLLGPHFGKRHDVNLASGQEEMSRSASRLMWLGVLLCLLPTPWAIGVAKITANPDIVATPIVLIPAVLFLSVGITLIIYRTVTAMIVLLRSDKGNH